MKILSAHQLREADAATICEQGIQTHELMERASRVFNDWFVEKFTTKFQHISIVCGTGNNGGDGLCIARHLIERGYQVNIIIVGEHANSGSNDFQYNLRKLKNTGFNAMSFFNETPPSFLTENDCIIDAIFGTGLNRRPQGIYAKAIESINHSKANVVSVDIPSGLFSDQLTDSICVEADFTLTFELPKLAFLLPEHEGFLGEWEVRSIGLSKDFINNIASDYEFIDAGIAKKFVHRRNRFDHKGTFGYTLVVAGKPGMTGAADLCGKACLVTGSGLVTVSCPHFQSRSPELMSVERKNILSLLDAGRINSAAIGPGMGTHPEEENLLATILEKIKFPIVVDADGLNILANNSSLLKNLPQHSILTPHPKEFERLFKLSETNSFNIIELQQRLSRQLNIIIIYKRAYTVITTPSGKTYFNSTGNPGMATAGSGDVLTGMISSLLAQNYIPEHAAVLAVYMHGLAGDIAMQETGGQNIIAGDIVDHIQKAFASILHPD